MNRAEFTDAIRHLRWSTVRQYAMHPRVKPVRVTVGLIMIFVGLMGLIFPIMPGWIFLVPGALLVGRDTFVGRWIHKQLHRLRVCIHNWRHRKDTYPPPPPKPIETDL